MHAKQSQAWHKLPITPLALIPLLVGQHAASWLCVRAAWRTRRWRPFTSTAGFSPWPRCPGLQRPTRMYCALAPHCRQGLNKFTKWGEDKKRKAKQPLPRAAQHLWVPGTGCTGRAPREWGCEQVLLPSCAGDTGGFVKAQPSLMWLKIWQRCAGPFPCSTIRSDGSTARWGWKHERISRLPHRAGEWNPFQLTTCQFASKT